MLSPNEELEKIKKDKSRIKKSAYNYFNKTKKQFPKDIAKLITHKILFFLQQKN